jgi:hypothetical protein
VLIYNWQVINWEGNEKNCTHVYIDIQDKTEQKAPMLVEKGLQ